jgi:glycosyltransferase involved in cell wall biosynthesis
MHEDVFIPAVEEQQPDGQAAARPRPEWVICFGPGDYHQFNPSCTTHIMHTLHKRGFGVLWVNPIPIGVPSLRRQGGRRRIWMRLKSYMRPMRRVRDRFYTISPIVMPARIGAGDGGWNETLANMQVGMARRMLRIRDPLIWYETPGARFAFDKLVGIRVYQLSDKYELSRYASPEVAQRLAINSYEMVQAADLVLCTAKTYQQELQQMRSDVHYLPHAVDLDLFRRDPDAKPPADIAAIPRPIIGYFGSLSSSNDQEMLRVVARRHRDWSIVLIGNITGGDWDDLLNLPNVHHLGFKPLSEIAKYGARFDVGVMNWIIDDWMLYVNPLKAREYLALGLPVVSVPIPEVVQTLSDVVYLADTPEVFLRQVERAIAEDSEDRRAARRAFAAEHTWEKYVDFVLQRLGVNS